MSTEASSTGSNTFRVLVIVTGSVATIKLVELVSKFLESCEREGLKTTVRVALTERAKHFLSEAEFESLRKIGVELFQDDDEWKWQARGDPVLHIELRKWADIGVIAPLSANSLSKMATGICDNLVTCIARAWDFKKPLLFAPAMNTFMYDHPLTAAHIAVLQSWGFTLIPTVEKVLVCGDKGLGAMASTDDIVLKVLQTMKEMSARRLVEESRTENTS